MKFLLVLGVMVTACGYRTVGGAPKSFHMGAAFTPGVELDAAGVLHRSFARAVARHPALKLEDGAEARWELEVEIFDMRSGLAPFAEPGVRAAENAIVLSAEVRVREPGGAIVWTSPRAAGEAQFLTPAGRMEALDGALRRSEKRAIEQAAERLAQSLAVGFRAKP